MKLIAFISLLAICNWNIAQLSEEEIETKRTEHEHELYDPEKGVLTKLEIEHFQGLDYFPFDNSYQIEATITKDKGKKFQMLTSSNRLPWYRRYGFIDFEINGIHYRLEAYQNLQLKKDKKYKKYLFIPFYDLSSGKTTYGSGRFLDIDIPDNNSLILDFNLAYNPYCAYSHRYSCPIPPEENSLEVEINAGEKTPPGHD